MNNCTFTVLVQRDPDLEALQVAGEIAAHSGEIVCLRHGIRSLGFVTKDGSLGLPERESAPVRPKK